MPLFKNNVATPKHFPVTPAYPPTPRNTLKHVFNTTSKDLALASGLSYLKTSHIYIWRKADSFWCGWWTQGCTAVVQKVIRRFHLEINPSIVYTNLSIKSLIPKRIQFNKIDPPKTGLNFIRILFTRRVEFLFAMKVQLGLRLDAQEDLVSGDAERNI